MTGNSSLCECVPLALIVIAVAPVHSQELAAKLPIPDETAQKAALELVTEVYKSEYEQAKTPQQKVTLAKNLLQASAGNIDSVQQRDDLGHRFTAERSAGQEVSEQNQLCQHGGDTECDKCLG